MKLIIGVLTFLLIVFITAICVVIELLPYAILGLLIYVIVKKLMD